MYITDKVKIERYYNALLERKQDFVGIFFAGVKTTLVFCLATCRARKPELENVEFYTSLKDALDHGYRPCKICNPTEHAKEAPHQVKWAIRLVKENPKEKITDCQLREKTLSPEVICRWFNKNYGMTFQTYQRMYRINHAYQELKKGRRLAHPVFATGEESLRGFGYTLKKVAGKSEQKRAEKNIILINRMTTPLGPMFVCATGKGVCLLEFVDRRMLETELKDLQKLLKAKIIIGENAHIKQAKKEVAEYFAGERKVFGVALDTPGTNFQNLVWDCLKDIEFGKTITYQQQAEKINHPKAVRAVASANGFNRVSMVVPCHRVIGKDGKMTGYGGGIERKRWLINHEGKNTSI